MLASGLVVGLASGLVVGLASGLLASGLVLGLVSGSVSDLLVLVEGLKVLQVRAQGLVEEWVLALEPVLAKALEQARVEEKD